MKYSSGMCRHCGCKLADFLVDEAPKYGIPIGGMWYCLAIKYCTARADKSMGA